MPRLPPRIPQFAAVAPSLRRPLSSSRRAPHPRPTSIPVPSESGNTSQARHKSELMAAAGTDTHGLAPIISSNRAWSSKISSADPSFFQTLAKGQSPAVLWLGCSDSRVPETTILGLKPGEVFTHRNIANIIPPTDLSSLAVIEYAVVYLKVQHIVICGHTSCGGVAAALGNKRLGKLDTWLMPLRQLRMQHAEAIQSLPEADRSYKLVELNVRQGVETLRQNPDVIEAANERGLEVHGMIFDIASGELKRLETSEPEGHTEKRRAAFQCA